MDSFHNNGTATGQQTRYTILKSFLFEHTQKEINIIK